LSTEVRGPRLDLDVAVHQSLSGDGVRSQHLTYGPRTTPETGDPAPAMSNVET
jgi:hypothetical protein